MPSGPPRLPIEHGALLTAERDRYVRRAVGLLAACVQQRLTTADRLIATARQIRKLRHGAIFLPLLDDIAGGAQSFAEIDVGRLCARAGLAQPTRQAVRTDSDGRRRYLDCEWQLPGRSTGRPGGGRLLPPPGRQLVERHEAGACGRPEPDHGAAVRTIELRLEAWEVMADLRRAGVPSVPIVS